MKKIDCLRIALAGEVDAGKSTLIGRFLYEMDSLPCGLMEEMKATSKRLGKDLEFAYLLDSFEEERKGELTIDTTQAFCRNKRGQDFIFIDVPGHQGLLKNMLSGSSYADMAAVVIDARKSVEEQTRRHAFILKFLGVEELVFILNKMDLAGFSEQAFNRVRADVLCLSDKINILARGIIPISATQGDNLVGRSKNMPWYKEDTLLEVLNNYSYVTGPVGGFRFVVQDIYDTGRQKAAVGEILSGKVKKGDKVIILPSLETNRIKDITVFNKRVFSAMAPQAVGLILDEMNNIRRGQIICKSALPGLFSKITARVIFIQPLRINEELLLKCLTQETSAKITRINHILDSANLSRKAPTSGVGGSGRIVEAVVATQTPLVLERYEGRNALGRFTLHKNDEICAIGVIP